MTALKKGFTLIELLIVIAILGVLAVVVLVAINPVQQLARTRDAGRISSVSQLGHAIESYYTSHDGTYPSGASTQASLQLLQSSGEINVIPAQVTNTLSSYCTNHYQGWCYASDTDSAALWSNLESDSQRSQITGCVSPNYAVAVYSSMSGKVCTVCSTTTPTANFQCP